MQINNNNNNIKQENKELKLEKKNKQNSGIPKPALYTGLSIVGVAAFGIAGKIIWDKLKKNDNNDPDKQIDEFKGWYDRSDVELTEADINWINNYIVVFNQVFPYCWHNASMQYLACPEIRAKKFIDEAFVNSSRLKIINMIDYINKIFEDKSRSSCFEGNVNFNKSKRQVADGQFLVNQPDSFLFGCVACASMYDNWYPINYGIMNAILTFNFECDLSKAKQKITNLIDNYKYIITNANIFVDYGIMSNRKVGSELKNFIVDFGVQNMKTVGKDVLSKIFHENNINFLQDKGYYPTFVAVWDDVVEYSSCPHWMAYYIVYDKDQNIKYFIQTDGCKKGIRLMTKEEGLNQLKKYKKNVVKYSSRDIVEEFYTPEFLQWK